MSGRRILVLTPTDRHVRADGARDRRRQRAAARQPHDQPRARPLRLRPARRRARLRLLRPGLHQRAGPAGREHGCSRTYFPQARSRTAAQFKQDQASQINTLLALIYVLLALSVIVSLFGIVNTLILSIYERTRELGMMRAIGTSRRQIRQMIRYESVITALIGGVFGLVIGVIGAVLVTTLLLSGSGLRAVLPGRDARHPAVRGRARRRARRPAARQAGRSPGRARRARGRVARTAHRTRRGGRISSTL